MLRVEVCDKQSGESLDCGKRAANLRAAILRPRRPGASTATIGQVAEDAGRSRGGRG